MLKKQSKKRQKSPGSGTTPSLSQSSKGGRIQTNWDIQWNRSTVIFYSALILIPYLTALIMTARTGNMIIVGILLFAGLLVGLLYFVLRKIDQWDDF